jgi:hypothetical protein
MNHSSPAPEHDLPKPILPPWIMQSSAPETLEDAAFASGAALVLLHVALNDPNTNVPKDLLRNRLALNAAVKCCKIEGSAVTEVEIRDALLLVAPGDARGPSGDMLALWTAVARYSLHSFDWIERYITSCPVPVREFLTELFRDTPDAMLLGTPVAQACSWAGAILEEFPRQEAIALQCADVALARALGWSHPVPLCAQHLKRKAFRALDDGNPQSFQLAFNDAVARGANDATRLAYDLARRAERLLAVAPKLRAKGSIAAVDLFLSEDAVLPSSMLSPRIHGTSIEMTPRAARRFCDRLVKLGVARELTGRSTFRLYGVA